MRAGTFGAMTSSSTDGPAHFASLDFIAPLSHDRADRLASRLNEGDPAVVVDIGCGWGGLLLRVLARSASAVGVGVDIDEVALERGRQLASTSGLAERVRFVTDLELTGISAADVTISCGASHAFGTTEQALAALFALTEPGGRALFAEGFRDDPSDGSAAGAEVMDDLVDLADLVDQAIAAGFRPLWIETASRDELEHFESGYLADDENWLVEHPAHPDVDRVRGRADAHRTRWLRGYRRSFGFAYLTLGRPAAVTRA